MTFRTARCDISPLCSYCRLRTMVCLIFCTPQHHYQRHGNSEGVPSSMQRLCGTSVQRLFFLSGTAQCASDLQGRFGTSIYFPIVFNETLGEQHYVARKLDGLVKSSAVGVNRHGTARGNCSRSIPCLVFVSRYVPWRSDRPTDRKSVV